jgi:hypothetical protein
MRAALAYAATRERHIQYFTRQLLVTGRGFKLLFARAEFLLQRFLGPVDERADARSLVWRQSAETFQLLGQQTLLSQVPDTDVFDKRGIGRCGDGRLGLRHQRLQMLFDSTCRISHGSVHSRANKKGKGRLTFPFR